MQKINVQLRSRLILNESDRFGPDNAGRVTKRDETSKRRRARGTRPTKCRVLSVRARTARTYPSVRCMRACTRPPADGRISSITDRPDRRDLDRTRQPAALQTDAFTYIHTYVGTDVRTTPPPADQPTDGRNLRTNGGGRSPSVCDRWTGRTGRAGLDRPARTVSSGASDGTKNEGRPTAVRTDGRWYVTKRTHARTARAGGLTGRRRTYGRYGVASVGRSLRVRSGRYRRRNRAEFDHFHHISASQEASVFRKRVGLRPTGPTP